VKSGRRNYKPPISEHHRPPGTTGATGVRGPAALVSPRARRFGRQACDRGPLASLPGTQAIPAAGKTPMFKEDVKAGDFGSAYAAAAVEMDALGRPVRCVTSRMQAFGTQTYRAETPHIFA